MITSKADEVLRYIERLAQTRYLPIIGSERGRILVELIRRIKPKRILEVGTFVGYSTILMGKELESDTEIITIEIDKDEAELAKQNIRRAEIRPRVTVLVGDALELSAKLDGEFDLVFLDAAKSEYLSYLRNVEGNLRKGSVVLADNAGMYSYSMRRYLDYVRKWGKYESKFVPAGGDGIEVSTKL